MRPKYSKGVDRLLESAHTAASKDRHRFVHTEYLLLALLQEPNSATQVLKRLGFDRRALRDQCENLCKIGKHRAAFDPAHIKLTTHSQAILTYAGQEMQSLDHGELDSRHLLMGMLREEEGKAGRLLRNAGVTLEAVLVAIHDDIAAPESDSGDSRKSRESRGFVFLRRMLGRA
jgi:ATP-dependent Clp protease ATP-binding subunit ClpC